MAVLIVVQLSGIVPLAATAASLAWGVLTVRALRVSIRREGDRITVRNTWSTTTVDRRDVDELTIRGIYWWWPQRVFVAALVAPDSSRRGDRYIPIEASNGFTRRQRESRIEHLEAIVGRRMKRRGRFAEQ
ncbi:MAG TPA: hypothetical protein VM618_05865 [Acidimicrobiia bacterium]|nr:hypothetical protein [Acidimicrobiia bacterium]